MAQRNTFLAGLISGFGQEYAQGRERKRKEEEQARQAELAILGKIPMEELDAEQQKLVLRRQLDVIEGGKRRSPLAGIPGLGKLFGGGKKTDLDAHPVMRLLSSLTGGQAAGGSDGASLPGLPPVMGGAEGAPLPWESEGGAAEVAPLPALRGASPGAARPGGLPGVFGPNYRQRLQMHSDVAGQQYRQQQETQDEFQRKRREEELGLIPGLGLGPELEKYAKAETILGRNLPTLPTPRVPHEPRTTWVKGPDDSSRLVTEEEAMRTGLPKWETPQGPSALQERMNQRIDAKMTLNPGITRDQAQQTIFAEDQRKEMLDLRAKELQNNLSQRMLGEPSSRETQAAFRILGEIDAAQSQARREALKLMDRFSPEGMQFRQRSGRDPASTDVQQAEEEAFEAILRQRTGMTPQQARSVALGPFDVLGGGIRPNAQPLDPTWRPTVR